jgi:hypothetical protein
MPSSQFNGQTGKIAAKLAPFGLIEKSEDRITPGEFILQLPVSLAHTPFLFIPDHCLSDTLWDKKGSPAFLPFMEVDLDHTAGRRIRGQNRSYIFAFPQYVWPRKVLPGICVQLRPYAERRLRFLLRRRLITARPCDVDMRLRKPCLRLRLRLLG